MNQRRLYQKAIDLFAAIIRNRVFRLLINVLVFGFCIVYLLKNFQNIASDMKQVRVNGWWLLLAFSITWIVDWMGGVSWWQLLLGFNQKVSWLESWQAHFKSALVKYVPGFIWQYLGKGYMTREMGVSPLVMSILMVWEFVIMVITGLGIGFVFLPAVLPREWGLPGWVWYLVVAVGGIVLFVLQGLPFAAPWLFNQLNFAGLTLNRKNLFSASLVVAAGWMLHGVALWSTVRAFDADLLRDVSFFVFAFSISLVAGILALPVPNGLGVREGIMIYLISRYLPLSTSLLVATISRLEIETRDFVCELAVAIYRKIRARSGSNKRYPENYY